MDTLVSKGNLYLRLLDWLNLMIRGTYFVDTASFPLDNAIPTIYTRR